MPVLEGRSPALPMMLELAHDPLELRVWRRVLPGKRYVAQARWQGREVLAKVFVGHGARRRAKAEQRGVELLLAHNVATPALLHAESGSFGVCLLFEFLSPAPSLGEAWKQPALAATHDERDVLLVQALALLGQMHRRGIWHTDLHLGNLLCHERRLYVIDGDSIRTLHAGKALPADRAQAHLGRFLSQFGLEAFPSQAVIEQSYGPLPGSYAALHEAVLAATESRLKKYLKKIQRECTEVSRTRDAAGVLLVSRTQGAPDRILQLMTDPDAAMQGGHFYKLGGSARVAGIEADGQRYVLKRYNIKGLKHWLMRFWRPSRAWQSWVNAHALRFSGIATPAALAVREKRHLGILRSLAWLLLAHGGDEDILSRWQNWRERGLPPIAECEALVNLVRRFWRAGFSHGDFKGHNILWYENDWQLIDLDAMTVHRRPTRRQRAQQRDRARLLRNWPATSELHQWLDANLPQP